MLSAHVAHLLVIMGTRKPAYCVQITHHLWNYSMAHVYLQPCVHWTGPVGTQQRIFAWKGWYLDSTPAAKERYQYT